MFLKNKKNILFFQTKFLLAVFLAVLGIGFLNIKEANAGWCVYMDRGYSDPSQQGNATLSPQKNTCTKSGNPTCNSDGTFGGNSGSTGCKYFENEAQAQAEYNKLLQGAMNENATNAKNVLGSDECSGFTIISHFFKCILLAILHFMGALLSLAATVFAKFVNPQDVATIGNNPAVYDAWTKVRDVLNVSFIMVLLFSAFCTVFQVDKFNYKAVLRTLIIMALLVNFSFPIARWIIDFSNILMTYMLNNLGFEGKEGKIFGTIADKGGLSQLLNAGINSEYWTLIADIVFVFLLAITLLAIGVLLLIRLVVLTILVIFSPIAFVGSIVPFFSSQTSKWWDTLFQQSFFGPIMIFMLYLAMNLMSAINTGTGASVQQIAGTQSIHPSAIASMALLMVPIVILWVGLGFAQELKVVGAGAVMKYAHKAIGWGKSAAAWGTYRGAGWVVKQTGKQTGITGGVKKYWEKEFPFGPDAAKKRKEARENWVYAKMGGKTDPIQDMKKKAKEYKEENMSTGTLADKTRTGDPGAAFLLASEGKMNATFFKEAMDKITDAKVKDEITKKTKDKNLDVVIQYRIDNEGLRGNVAEEIRIATEELEKINPDKWKEQDIAKIVSDPSMMQAAHDVYNNMNIRNKGKVTENMSGDKYAAGRYSIW